MNKGAIQDTSPPIVTLDAGDRGFFEVDSMAIVESMAYHSTVRDTRSAGVHNLVFIRFRVVVLFCVKS